MTTFAPVFAPRGTSFYVDASAPAAVGDGSIQQPFATIAAAIAVAAAGDEIHIAAGAYTEDLAFAAGEDFRLVAQDIGSVTITGSMTITDATVQLTGLNLVDDGAGSAIHFTGTAADTLTLIGCDVQASATGDQAMEADNTAGTIIAVDCTFGADVANANEVITLESGSLDFRRCDIIHASNVAEAFVAEGDAASASILFVDCRFVGSVNAEAAVAAPTSFILENCDYTVGAISAIIVAATCTVVVNGGTITSTDAGNDALDGAGTVTFGQYPVFDSTADEVATTLTVTHTVGTRMQHGTVAAAGASPQTDAVTLPQVFPTANYDIQLTFEATGGGADDVICSVDEGTIATTGFSVVTTSAAAAAISGNVHWFAIHD